VGEEVQHVTNCYINDAKTGREQQMFAVRSRISIICMVLGALVFCSSAFAAKRKGGEMTLKSLTDNSDAVVVGKCKAKRVEWVGKSLETSYDVEIQDTLKGKKYKAGEAISVTVPGGELTTPPLTQYVEMVPLMYQGEDVALFIKEKAPEPSAEVKGRIHPKSKVWTSPQVVGWYEGKFTVYQDKQGKQKITRIDTERSGVIPGSRTLEKLVRALANGEAKAAEGQLVEIGDGVKTTPEGKELFERASKAAADLNADDGHGHSRGKKPATEAELDPLRPRKPLVVQDFEQFKAQVRKLAEQK
jgi:hypothetical protein